MVLQNGRLRYRATLRSECSAVGSHSEPEATGSRVAKCRGMSRAKVGMFPVYRLTRS